MRNTIPPILVSSCTQSLFIKGNGCFSKTSAVPNRQYPLCYSVRYFQNSVKYGSSDFKLHLPRQQTRQQQAARPEEVLDLALERVHLLENGVGLLGEAGDEVAGWLQDFHAAEGVHDDAVKRRTAGVRLEVAHLLERQQEEETLGMPGLPRSA